jgi:hypothetical protein
MRDFMKLFITLLFLSITINVFAAGKLSLSDLGISNKVTEKDHQIQNDLTTRTKKLQTHVVWGGITQGLMLASLFTGGMAKGSNELHQYLGITTALTYWTAFYFSQTAPKPALIGNKGWNIKIHKALMWIHAPMMILTPIIGYMAWQKNKHDENLTGIEKFKGTAGGIAAGAFTLSTTVMFFEF